MAAPRAANGCGGCCCFAGFRHFRSKQRRLCPSSDSKDVVCTDQSIAPRKVVPATLESSAVVGASAACNVHEQELAQGTLYKHSAREHAAALHPGDPMHSGLTTETSVGSEAGSDASLEATEAAKGSSAAAAGEGLVNGFSSIPELETLHVRDANVAPYSMPQEALTYEPDASAVVTRFQNGDGERMIFCNTPLDEEELLWLRRCRDEATRRGLSFLPSLTVAAGRFLGDAKGDVRVALERMQQAQEWRMDYFRCGPINDASVAEDMGLGILYFCGRDRALRPALVVRPARIPKYLSKEKDVAERFNRLFLFCMEYFLRFMVVPGKVENICVILDLKNISLTQLPLPVLMEIKTVLSQQHAGRVFRFYICNMPVVISVLAAVVQAAMTERQRQKIVFVRNVEELRSEFALHHLEHDLGGTRPTIAEFLPFPLQPGPFDGGCRTGPRQDAVPKVHEVFSPSGSRGRLWDPSRSLAENAALEFAPGAGPLLQRCGLQPPVCPPTQEPAPREPAPAPPAAAAAEPRAAAAAQAQGAASREGPRTRAAASAADELPAQVGAGRPEKPAAAPGSAGAVAEERPRDPLTKVMDDIILDSQQIGAPNRCTCGCIFKT